MKGILYGVGVGPGDPELLTLKAVKIIINCDIIVFPGKTKEDCLAYQIALGAIPEIDKKAVLPVFMPMTKDPLLLEESHQNGAKLIASQLDAGKTAAFLTLGDPTVYSTYIYLHQRIAALGYETHIINGIPSFCAAAAALNIGLVEKSDPLHIIPASYDRADLIRLPGTKVLMKAGKNFFETKKDLVEAGLKIAMVENCGLPNEHIYQQSDELPDMPGYYSLIIAKN